MRKQNFFLMAIIFLFAFSINNAQLSNWGVKAALNNSTFSGDGLDNIESKWGYGIGVYVNFPMNEQFSIQPELYYNNKGATYSESDTESGFDYTLTLSADFTIPMNYLEIPILGVYSVNPNFSIFAGPYFDIFLSGKAEYESDYHYADDYGNTEDGSSSGSEEIDSEDMTIPGYGIVAGAEYNFGKFNVGARYSLGLNNIGDSSDEEIKHQNIQFTVGFQINN